MDFIDDDSDVEDISEESRFLLDLCQETFKFILKKKSSHKGEESSNTLHILVVCDSQEKVEV